MKILKNRNFIFSLFLNLAAKNHFFKLDMLSLYNMKVLKQSTVEETSSNVNLDSA